VEIVDGWLHHRNREMTKTKEDVGDDDDEEPSSVNRAPDSLPKMYAKIRPGHEATTKPPPPQPASTIQSPTPINNYSAFDSASGARFKRSAGGGGTRDGHCLFYLVPVRSIHTIIKINRRRGGRQGKADPSGSGRAAGREHPSTCGIRYAHMEPQHIETPLALVDRDFVVLAVVCIQRREPSWFGRPLVLLRAQATDR
jgi:hypothetical protein